jgi:hypothetical protein
MDVFNMFVNMTGKKEDVIRDQMRGEEVLRDVTLTQDLLDTLCSMQVGLALLPAPTGTNHGSSSPLTVTLRCPNSFHGGGPRPLLRSAAMTAGCSGAGGEAHGRSLSPKAHTPHPRNSTPDGCNKRTFRDRSVYEGEFIAGKPHVMMVPAKKVYPDGNSYEGEYMNGRRHGRGKAMFPDGRCYEGEWREGDICGAGKLMIPDGPSFEGEFLRGLPISGRMLYPRWLDYEGEFKEGMPHGRGKATFSNCSLTSYEGNFVESKFHGTGHMLLPCGTRYEGTFVDAMFSRGRMLFTDGSCYDGEFEESKFHGGGSMTYAADGRTSLPGLSYSWNRGDKCVRFAQLLW